VALLPPGLSQLKLRPEAVVYETKKDGAGQRVIAVLQGDKIPEWPEGSTMRAAQVMDPHGERGMVQIVNVKQPDGRTFFFERDHCESVPVGSA
jgi:hypothetical protein